MHDVLIPAGAPGPVVVSRVSREAGRARRGSRVNADAAVKEIARIIQDGSKPARRLDRIFRILVQCGAIEVKP